MSGRDDRGEKGFWSIGLRGANGEGRRGAAAIGGRGAGGILRRFDGRGMGTEAGAEGKHSLNSSSRRTRSSRRSLISWVLQPFNQKRRVDCRAEFNLDSPTALRAFRRLERD